MAALASCGARVVVPALPDSAVDAAADGGDADSGTATAGVATSSDAGAR